MTSVSLYSRERSEELRSRISLIKCSLRRLKQDFWTIFHQFLDNDKTPPYIFPVSTFRKLDSLVENLQVINEHANPDFIPNAVFRYNLLNVTSNEALFELVRLQNVLAQRICSLGTMKLVEYQQILQIEYGTITKAYNAVDALSFELVEKILGSKWIRKERYTPISLFDSTGYEIDIYSNVVSVPYYDSFRARFWPALAHEIAHILVSLLVEQEGKVASLMIEEMPHLLDVLHYELNDSDGQFFAFMQLIELTSDVIATYICPVCFLSGATILSLPSEDERSEGAIIGAIREAHHPPSDARIVLMKEVLEQTGVLEADKQIRKIAESSIMFFARKNLALLSDSSYGFIQDYNEIAETYSQKILDLLPQLGLRPFGGDEWNVVREAFKNPNENQLSPIQNICLDWIKRIRMTKNDGYLVIRDFFNKRIAEPKIFEQMVNSMYIYYENEIIKNIKEVDTFDLWIGTSEG